MLCLATAPAPQAEEVGPHKNHSGPGLVAFRNVRWAPPDVAEWIATHPIISRYVQRTLWLRRGPAAGGGGGAGAGGAEAPVEDQAAAGPAELADALRAPGALPADLTGLRVLAAPNRSTAAIMVGARRPAP